LIAFSEGDLSLLREIAKSVGRKNAAGAIDHARCVRLETAGLLRTLPTNG
jgi:hypothetical protein